MNVIWRLPLTLEPWTKSLPLVAIADAMNNINCSKR